MVQMSWADVGRQISMDDIGKHDAMRDALHLSMKDGEIVLDEPVGEQGFKHLALTDHATGQFCSRMGIPVKYYRTVAERNRGLADAMFNDGFSGITRDCVMNRRKSPNVLMRMKGRVVRAALTDKYSVFDNKDVAEIVHDLSEGQFEHTIRSFSLSPTGFWLKVTCDDLAVHDPSAPGQFLKIGFTIGNSEVGARNVVSNPFIFRQACTNDAVTVTEKAISTRHAYLDHDALRRMMTKSIAYALRTGESHLNRVLETREVRIEKPSDVIKALCKKAQFSRKSQDAVLQAYQIEPEGNAWGVVNAFTRAAQGIEDTDKRVELESTAGAWMTQSKNWWEKMAA